MRVASWNMYAARAASLDEIAAELARLDADVLVLQEVHVYTRSGGVDQARALAERLGYAYAFAAAFADEQGAYGQAVLSRLRFAAVRPIALEAIGA